MSTGIIIIIVLAVIIIGYFISTQRSLVNLDEMCKNALSQIEVQLNSRWDALLGLAQVASKYAQHESETLIGVIKQRRGEIVNTPEAVNEQQSALRQVMGQLMAIRESYPELKADNLFNEVQDGVKEYEENVCVFLQVVSTDSSKSAVLRTQRTRMPTSIRSEASTISQTKSGRSALTTFSVM